MKNFTKEFHSGNWYMVISNEPPMTSSGNIYCKFDLIKYKNNFWGCPVNQIGTMEEILDVLKSWEKIDEESEYNNADIIEMEKNFISILENEISQ